LGPETSTTLAYISINTQTDTTRSEYILQAAGYKFSATGGLTNVAVSNSNFVVNSPQLADIESKLSKLTFNEGNELLVAGAGGSSSVIQGISTASGLAVDITATPSGGANRLLVDSRIGDGTYILSVNNDGSINTISPVVAKDADNAESTIQIFGRNNRLFTNTEITGGGNTLAINEDGSINVSGGGGGGGSSVVQGINTVDGVTAMNINATDNRLLVNSLVVGNTGNLLVINADGSINVSGGGGGGGSSSSVVQGINTVDGVTAMNINATSNRLLVNSLSIGKTAGGAEYPLVITSAGNLIVEAKCHDGANNAITSTVVSTKRGLDVNIIAGGGGGSETPQGTFNNIHSGNLTASTFSTALNINNLYGNESVISYEDTSISLTSFISIHGSFDNVNYFYIGVLQPAPISSSVRQASAVLKLKGLKWIRILNTNASSTATGVKATLFSG
jgi:hypothetical protein